MQRAGYVDEGIVLRERYSTGWVIEVLTTTGTMHQVNRTDVHFSIPNFISSDLAARCGDGFLQPSPTEVNARVEALKQMRLLAVNVEKAVQGSQMWDRQVPLNLYDEVKAVDPTMWGEISLKKATSLLYVNPTFINYYATHKYLADRPLRYVARDEYFRSQVFSIRPQRDVEEILEVDRLIKENRNRSGEGKYARFIRKAQKVISRWKHDPTLQTGPIRQDSTTPSWKEDDQLFLRFLLRSQQVRRRNQPDPYQMGCQTIISDITLNSILSDAVYCEILMKLGVIAPWQSYATLSTAANPTGDFTISNAQETTASKLFQQSQRISGTVLGPFDLHARDPLESVRQDHHGRVFVIDDPSAEELDDGISVERIPSEPDNAWVHVHVADPARYLHPGHALSHRARKQYESLYLVTKSYPLFPSNMMYDRAAPMSLASTEDSVEASRAITISIKLDNAGNMIDYKLQASILKNVRIISYDEVDAALGNNQHIRRRPFGGTGKPAAAGEPLTNEEVADLRLLFKLTEAQQQQRFKQNIIFPFRHAAEPRLVNLGPSEIQSPFLQGATYRGFPEIDYIVTSTMPKGSREMVAEMMKLAGRAASCVARDNGVPLIRRGMEPTIFGQGEEDLLAMRGPDGGVPFKEVMKAHPSPPSTTLSVELKAHSIMGIPASDGYSRITSPLRRYSDLLGHWQLHHILLGSNAPRRPPFDNAEMETLAREASLRSRNVKILATNDSLFWSVLAVKRFTRAISVRGVSTVDYSVQNPLSSLRGYIRSEPALTDFEHVAVVDLPDLGISGFMGGLKGHHIGDDVQAKIKTIELGRYPRITLEKV